MGLSIESFYHLSPEEFEITYLKWSELRDAEFRNSWEQTRKICYWSTHKPKNVMSMTVFMPLPWDKDRSKKKGKSQKLRDPERFKKLQQKYGSTI